MPASSIRLVALVAAWLAPLMAISFAAAGVDGPGREPPAQSEQTAGDHVVVVPGVTRSGVPISLEFECSTAVQPVPWPAGVPRPADRYPEHLQTTFERYVSYQIAYEPHLQRYSSAGDYLNYGRTQNYEGDTSLRWSAEGIPLVPYGDTYAANPLTTMQYALTLHGRSVLGQDTAAQFVSVARHLAGIQAPDGRFAFPLAYEIYLTGQRLEPGWTSGMAQGVALSVFSRAYLLTGDSTFLDAGMRSLSYLLSPASNGGPRRTMEAVDPSLAGHIWFDEYPGARPLFTLNGFGYTLLGLYDWAQLVDGAPDSSLAAGRAFECGFASLLSVIGLYDVGGMSAYDLGHLFFDVPPNLQVYYHPLHIGLLHALDSLRPNTSLKDWELLWRAAVDRAIG